MAYGLSDRELEVLWAVAEHGGLEEAAEKLGIAYATVRNHLTRVRSATGATTTLQAYHRITGGRKMRSVVTVSHEEIE